MKLSLTLLSLLSVVFISCGSGNANKQIDEGKVKGEVYESKDLGWTIEIPKGWKVVSKDKIDANDAKGKEAIEGVTGEALDTKSLKHLIAFQKDQFNIFTSTSQPFKEEHPGEYDEASAALNGLIYETFASKGIKTDTSSGKESIQGLDFHTFKSTVYGPDGKVLLYQILYSRLLNGYDFGVNLNYNNDEDKEVMMSAWKASVFTKK
jgi:hypothetical protein